MPKSNMKKMAPLAFIT